MRYMQTSEYEEQQEGDTPLLRRTRHTWWSAQGGRPPLPGQTGTPRERQQEVQEQTLFLNHTQEWILGRQPKYESWNYKDNLGDWFYDFEVGEDFLGVTPIK